MSLACFLVAFVAATAGTAIGVLAGTLFGLRWAVERWEMELPTRYRPKAKEEPSQ
jgi:membrane protein DedA with SNARE-associated domain